jgi:hypothetical protein
VTNVIPSWVFTLLPVDNVNSVQTRKATYFIDPLCVGVFGGDARKLSLRSCFPVLAKFEEMEGSVVLGVRFAEVSRFLGFFFKDFIASWNENNSNVVEHEAKYCCIPEKLNSWVIFWGVQ